MKNDNIIDKLLNDNILDEIQAELEKELDKPDTDYDKVAELTALISEFTGNTPDVEEIDKKISQITEEYTAQTKRNKIKIFYKWISALSACIAITLVLNAYTMVSRGDNIFTTVVEITKSGFSVDFFENPDGQKPTEILTTSLPLSTTNTNIPITSIPIPEDESTTNIITTVTPNITYPSNQSTQTTTPPESSLLTDTTTAILPTDVPVIGDIINEKCMEADVYPCDFKYSSDMELTDFSFERNEISTDCYFTFLNENSQLDIIIEQYYDTKDIPPVLISSNQDGYYQISGNIGDIILFDENSHTTAVFVYKNSVYTTVGHNINLSELEDIVMNYFPKNEN